MLINVRIIVVCYVSLCRPYHCVARVAVCHFVAPIPRPLCRRFSIVLPGPIPICRQTSNVSPLPISMCRRIYQYLAGPLLSRRLRSDVPRISLKDEITENTHCLIALRILPPKMENLDFLPLIVENVLISKWNMTVQMNIYRIPQ